MKLLSRDTWYNCNPQDKWAQDCPFCHTENSGNKEYIIWKGKHWFICHNKYPILGLENQLMAIPYRHIIYSCDLNDDERIEFWEVEKFMKDFYDIPNYFMFIREGLEGRSLEHIHYHFVPGRIPYEDIASMLQKQGF